MVVGSQTFACIWRRFRKSGPSRTRQPRGLLVAPPLFLSSVAIPQDAGMMSSEMWTSRKPTAFGMDKAEERSWRSLECV
ncbi:hypothetical protein GN956_G15112 [Arapaima gigas]